MQPHLDYACLLWSPVNEICETRRMASILREFTRKGNRMRSKSYQKRVAEFGLLSQERRVERCQAI